jgi:methionine synthase II (cobalamin-independent)
LENNWTDLLLPKMVGFKATEAVDHPLLYDVLDQSNDCKMGQFAVNSSTQNGSRNATGPVTILQWSFGVMINQGQKPVHKLAIRDEVIDLEKSRLNHPN